MFDLVISNGIIISPNNCYKPIIGSIGILNGLIEFIGEKSIPNCDAKESIDAVGKIVMPGLINGHCHGDMTLARGIGDDLTLHEQSDLYNPINWFHDIISDEELYYSRVLTYIEAILSGTTFILENSFWGIGEKAFKAFTDVGIKGGIVEDIFVDFKDPEKKKSIEQINHFKDQCEQYNILPVLGGMLEECFDNSSLTYQSSIVNQTGCLMTSHLSETLWRKQILINNFSSSSVQILDEFDMISDKYIGSHGVYLSKKDIQILKDHNAKIINTPLCEMKISDGIAPIPELIKNGIVVGLGTDGAMWNNSNDLFREMKGLSLLNAVTRGIRSIKTKDILDMATINGAKVFGLEKETGSLEVGKKADIILVDANQPHMAPIRLNHHENVASSLLYCATGRDVSDVIIDGNRIVENGRLLTLNVKDVIENVSTTSEKIGRYYEEVMQKRKSAPFA